MPIVWKGWSQVAFMLYPTYQDCRSSSRIDCSSGSTRGHASRKIFWSFRPQLQLINTLLMSNHYSCLSKLRPLIGRTHCIVPSYHIYISHRILRYILYPRPGPPQCLFFTPQLDHYLYSQHTIDICNFLGIQKKLWCLLYHSFSYKTTRMIHDDLIKAS